MATIEEKKPNLQQQDNSARIQYNGYVSHAYKRNTKISSGMRHMWRTCTWWDEKETWAAEAFYIGGVKNRSVSVVGCPDRLILGVQPSLTYSACIRPLKSSNDVVISYLYQLETFGASRHVA